MNLPLPGGRDLRKALRIYVAGRSRAWTADEKREAAGDVIQSASRMTDPAPEVDVETKFGVPVPRTLEFHRGPGTWRGELPGGRRRQRGPRDG